MLIEVSVNRDSKERKHYFRLMWKVVNEGVGLTGINVKESDGKTIFSLQADNLSELMEEVISSKEGTQYATL